MAGFWLKIAYFSYPFLIRHRPLPIFPLEFRGEVKCHGLLCGEGCMILTLTVFD